MTDNGVTVFRNTEFRNTDQTHDQGRHRRVPRSRSGLLVVGVTTLMVVALSGWTSSGAATALHPTRSGLVHDPVKIESTSHGMVTSTNWSGYAVTGATFTNVTASWIVPAVTCSGAAQADSAFWAGIDGFGKKAKTVEQVGTDSDCNKHSKQAVPTYYAWWEMFPQLSNNLSTSTYPVAQGDTMTASVTSSGSGNTLTFTMSIQDVSRGWGFATSPQTSTVKATQTSAEWIAEAPSICKGSHCKLSKLANFGVVNFSGATANGAPISSPSFNQNQIDMTKKKTVKATTSALAGGTAFNVTWNHG